MQMAPGIHSFMEDADYLDEVWRNRAEVHDVYRPGHLLARVSADVSDMKAA